MPETRRKILFTNTIANQYLQLAETLQLQPIVVPMISTTLLLQEQKNIIATIQNSKAHSWVFTSKNAVEYFNVIKDLIPWQNKKLLAVGEKTALHFNELSSQIIFPQEENATALATLIVKEKIKEVLFWCGNMRHHALPDALKNQEVNVEELEVYTTTMMAKNITVEYDAVACLSSSAAESFFVANTIDKTIPIFAIGQTTFETIKKWRNENIYLAEKPHVDILLNTIHQHFYS